MSLCVLLKVVEFYVIKKLVKLFKKIASKHIMIYFCLGYGEKYTWLFEESLTIVHSRSSKPLENNTPIPPKISRTDAITLDFRYDQSSVVLKL